MKPRSISRWLTNYAHRHDRPGYPLRVWVADVLSGWAWRLGL